MFQLYSLREDLDFGYSSAKLVPISEDSQEASYICCLASREEFRGNSRFMLNGYWVYPSIQTVFWKDSLISMGLVKSKMDFRKMRNLLAWPASSAEARLSIANSLGLNVFEEEADFEFSKQFRKDLDFARLISLVYVQAQLRGQYITKDSLKSLIVENPEKILNENLNFQISLRNKRDLEELLAGLDQGNRLSELKNDFRRILLNRLGEVQKFTPIQDDYKSMADYRKLFKSDGYTEAIMVKTKGSFTSIKNLGSKDSIKLLVEIG